MTRTHRQVLEELAFNNHGIVTTSMATMAGVPSYAVRNLAARDSNVKHVAYGVYEFTGLNTDTSLAPYAAAVAIGGDGAYLCGSSVLALHKLAFPYDDVAPCVGRATIRATTRRGHVLIERRRVVPSTLTRYRGIPSTTVRAALDECRSVLGDRYSWVCTEAARRGLLTEANSQEIDGNHMDRPTYAALRDYDVVASLERLTGPTTGTVKVAAHIDPRPNPVYDLADTSQVWALYNRTVRDGTAYDQTRLLNKTWLVYLWPYLTLPEKCRDTWSTRFPYLRVSPVTNWTWGE